MQDNKYNGQMKNDKKKKRQKTNIGQKLYAES